MSIAYILPDPATHFQSSRNTRTKTNATNQESIHPAAKSRVRQNIAPSSVFASVS